MIHTDLIPAVNMPIVAERMGLLPARTVCECSVGPLHESIAPGFKGKCQRLLLVEPLKRYADEAEQKLQVKVNRVAVGMEPGTLRMIDNSVSSFIEGTWAPTVPKAGSPTFMVDVVTFDTLDDGEIDIFNLDCEGQEWSVISKMKSLPKLFTIEICSWNPNEGKIKEWLTEHHYVMESYTGPFLETQCYIRHD